MYRKILYEQYSWVYWTSKAGAVFLHSACTCPILFFTSDFYFGFLLLWLCSLSSTTPARQTAAPSIAQSYQSNLTLTDNISYTCTPGLSLLHAKFNPLVACVYSGQITICRLGWWGGSQTCFLFIIYAFQNKWSVFGQSQSKNIKYNFTWSKPVFDLKWRHHVTLP